MPDELEDTILENAQGPKSISNDSGSATAHDLRELIEADKYLKNKTAASRGLGGLRFVKMIPPSAD